VASGGHARSGPAPDPGALRRDRADDATFWVVLPSEGRAGEPPVWPMSAGSDRELELWRRMWARPQATQWERMQLEYEVATYVRWFVTAEAPGAAVSAGTLVQRLADSLGLTIAGMRANRWKVAVDQVADRRAEKAEAEPAARPAPSGRSSRARFGVVDGAAG
jgi:hypothetical protein